MTGSGRPTPPFAFGSGDVGDVRSRFGREVAVDDALADRLAGVCEEVVTSTGSLVEAGRDWWPLSVSWGVAGEVPALPAVVARPRSAAEVAAVLAVCDAGGVPVTAAAGRSGVCGGSVPVFGGVALDLTGLAGMVAVDDLSLTVEVRAGTFGDDFEAELGAAHGLTLGHWPQSMAMSTVGGWLACRSAGQYSTRYGKIEDLVVGLEVALADGRVIRTGARAPRAAAGPDLTSLFVGSEGTLGVITEARLRVRPRPTGERSAVYGFASFADGLDACRRVLRRGATPAVVRLYDAAESARQFHVEDRAVLLVFDEADPALVGPVATVVAEECGAAERLDSSLVEQWLAHRNEVAPLAALAREGIVADTIEIAASWTALPAIYGASIAALSALDGTVVASAHQSHAYPDGACLYFTFAGTPTPAGASSSGGGSGNAADIYYCQAWDAVMSATLAHGGALSHHHGVGINRGRYLAGALGPAFEVLASVKAALDPRGILNPGKLGLPSPFGEAPWP
ncbi:MAG TPA: FAD-binding oxidoreductase [Acidimicrobiales bacterium]|jgi:alkyldihydroxyacetonephosphate synthase|nr:FAD-binding oxidoreductase [Acidimicrobiales bacterium]